jgi:hypothetical protein
MHDLNKNLSPNDKHHCSVCGKEMNITTLPGECVDYWCGRFAPGELVSEDHHFSYRIQEKSRFIDAGAGYPATGYSEFIMTKMRIRLTDEDGLSLRLKMHYDLGYSEVWSKANAPRIKINQIIVPNFNQLDVLKNKIKILLTFS